MEKVYAKKDLHTYALFVYIRLKIGLIHLSPSVWHSEVPKFCFSLVDLRKTKELKKKNLYNCSDACHVSPLSLNADQMNDMAT